MKFNLWSNMFEVVEEMEKYAQEHMEEDGLSGYALDYVYQQLDWELDDLRNSFKGYQGNIIAIADLGLWDGRRVGYKEYGNITLDNILYSECDYVEWFIDRYDLKMTGHHHDGTNHVIYREIKEELTDTQVENFLEKLYLGTATKRDITRYTRSLKNVAKELSNLA